MKGESAMSETSKPSHVCPKCGCRQYDAEPIHTTGGTLSRMLNYQNKRFIAVSCSQCGYTELYRETSDRAGNIIDLFFGA